VADRGDDRARLDRALVRHLADLAVSRVEAARWVRGAKVVVNDLVAGRPSQRLFRGDQVRVELPPPPPGAPPLRAQEMALAVLHEDEHLLAVNKPAGLVVHPTWGHRDGTLLNGLLWRAAGDAGAWRPRLVHRLDRGTSGVLLVTKTAPAHKVLARAWQRREVRKEYLAVVLGRPAARSGRVELAIERDPADPKRWLAGSAGRPSVTLWELQAEAPAGGTAVALLRCRPETGRTHQIRVHLAAAGLPVAGDPLYGGGAAALATRPLAAALAGLGRQALHAATLSFRHPATGEPVRLVAPLPADLRELLAAAGVPVPAT
jgi:23S rRNA pseudouridine1911/1915/1917 synthase